MKISLQTAFAPVSNNYAQQNVTAPKNYPQNFKTLSDAFVKSNSNVAFKGEKPEYREAVIEQGSLGIVKTLAKYAKPYAYAADHKMPVQEDLDRAMDEFFPLSCCAASTYIVDEKTTYPSAEEFASIIKTLWNESKKLEGGDIAEYTTEKILRMKERGRQPYIEKFIADDIGRAMDVFAKRKYGLSVTNEDEADVFARRLYADNRSRTIKSEVSWDVIKKGEDSKYYDILTSQPDSGAMLDYLLYHKDVFFGEPKSLEQRYEDQKAIIASIESEQRERQVAREKEDEFWDQFFIEQRY